MQRVAVVDFSMGNLRSVAKALAHVAGSRHETVVTSDPGVIASAERVVFPGQGAIRVCMKELTRLGLLDVLREAIATRPFLGICLGLQALLEDSEEDTGTRALGVFSGRVRRLPGGVSPTGERLKIPHMGWNNVHRTRAHPLWQGIEDGERFYFVHSYYVDAADPALVAAHVDYGQRIACALADGNLFAVQFHPEKSQRAGLKLLENFLGWEGRPG